MSDMNRPPHLAENVPAIEPRRILLGFLSESTALRKLQSDRTVGTPIDPIGDSDTGAEQSELETEYANLWKETAASIGPRNTFDSADVELTELPDTPEIQNHIEAFVDDPHTRASLDNRPTENWEIKLVPIKISLPFSQPFRRNRTIMMSQPRRTTF